MNKISFGIGESNLVIESKPEVTYKGYFSLVRNDKEVGTIDATFDFSKMPEKYHQLAFTILQKRGTRIVLAL